MTPPYSGHLDHLKLGTLTFTFGSGATARKRDPSRAVGSGEKAGTVAAPARSRPGPLPVPRLRPPPAGQSQEERRTERHEPPETVGRSAEDPEDEPSPPRTGWSQPDFRGRAKTNSYERSGAWRQRLSQGRRSCTRTAPRLRDVAKQAGPCRCGETARRWRPTAGS